MVRAKDLPPYLDIDPDQTEMKNGSVTTDLFSNLARACAEGRIDLQRRGLAGHDPKALRRFSTWEITRYLIPVAAAHFRRVLRQNPDLPQGMTGSEAGAKWFTLAEVLTLRSHFATEGSKARNYLPYRPDGLPAKIVSVANFKRGVGKTSTAAHLAMSAALDGYRVLVIDLDGQGALTSIFGGRIEDEWQTVFPLLARHYADHLRQDNRDRVARGHPPQPLDQTLDRALTMSAEDLVQTTHWPTIDLIGAQLDLYRAEMQIPLWQMAGRTWRPWDALRAQLAGDGLLERYDIVIVDTAPSSGHLTVGALAAADILLVPLGAQFSDFDATGRFFDLLHRTFSSIETTQNIAARALGLGETRFEWDAVRAVITRFEGNQQAETGALMQAYMGETLSPYRQDHTALIGEADGQVASLYEADYRDTNREVYARARAPFDETYADVKRLLVGAWRRDERAAARDGDPAAD